MYDQIASNKRKTVLLITIFIIVVFGIGYILSQFFGYGPDAMIAAVGISLVMSFVGYFNGDKVALWSSKAEPITSSEAPQVYRIVENLAITNGMPMSKIYIINSNALNAFATGRDPAHASIAITSGLINALEDEELEGVLAHELSHVKNYDIRVMTLVVVLVGTISIVADMFLRARMFHGRGDRDNKINPVFLVVGLVLILLSPVIAELIKLAISRKREFLADASGSLLTRYPEGLARALEKISKSEVPLETASQATAHLFIANPFSGKNIMKLFSTHPPIEERIKRLRSMI